MKHLLTILSLILLANTGFCQNNDYTILRVNEDKTAKIGINTKDNYKSRGDIIKDEDKICWTKDDQSIEVRYNVNGVIYTFYASSFYNCKDNYRERFCFLKYLRTATTATKGSNKDCFLYIFVQNDIAVIDVPARNLDRLHYFYLKQDSHEYHIINQQMTTSLVFPVQALVDSGFRLDNKIALSLYYYDNGHSILISNNTYIDAH